MPILMTPFLVSALRYAFAKSIGTCRCRPTRDPPPDAAAGGGSRAASGGVAWYPGGTMHLRAWRGPLPQSSWLQSLCQLLAASKAPAPLNSASCG